MFRLPQVALIAVTLVAFSNPVDARQTKKPPADPAATAKTKAAAKTPANNPLDTNGDGKVDAKERAEGRKKLQQAALAKKHAVEAEAKAKREKAHAEQLKRFDTNGNGKIDPEELGAVRRALSGREGSGPSKASRPAKPTPIPAKELEAMRRQFDANGDGKLSGDELAKFKEALRKKRGN